MPIDDERYSTPEMRRIFEEETRVQRLLDVEAALAWAHGEVGNIPQKDAKKIIATASLEHVKLNHIKEIEHETKHDVVALVRVLADACGPSGAYVHLGATSSDITDTATALQLKDALELIENKLYDLQKSSEYILRESNESSTINGVSTYNLSIPAFQFTVCVNETSRNLERLRECKERILVGKMSGSVGTQAAFGIHAEKIQELVMNRLGIKSAEIATQIVQRDRHAELVCVLTLIATSLEKFVSVYLMTQRLENGQLPGDLQTAYAMETSVSEALDACRTVCGLARFVRSLLIPALENISIRHEQDLTQSSSERFIIPQACILVDYMLLLTSQLVNNVKVDLQKRF